MATLGQKPATQHVSLQKQTITGNGGTSYTLQQSVGSALDVAVFINNTRQEPTTAYSASGTTLTMTGAVNSSDNFYVIFLGKAITTTGLPVDAVGTANINANAVTAAKLHDDAVTHAKLPSGSVLQVKQAQFLGNEYHNNASYTDVTDLSINITPNSTSSKMLVSFHFHGHASSNQRFGVRVVRDGSMILSPVNYSGQGLGSTCQDIGVRNPAHALGTGKGANIGEPATSMSLLDSPNTTSQVTYKLQAFAEGSQYIYINTIVTNSNANTVFVPISTLTVMEIAG